MVIVHVKNKIKSDDGKGWLKIQTLFQSKGWYTSDKEAEPHVKVILELSNRLLAIAFADPQQLQLYANNLDGILVKMQKLNDITSDGKINNNDKEMTNGSF